MCAHNVSLQLLYRTVSTARHVIILICFYIVYSYEIGFYSNYGRFSLKLKIITAMSSNLVYIICMRGMRVSLFVCVRVWAVRCVFYTQKHQQIITRSYEHC